MLPGNHELLQRGAATQSRLVHNGRDRDSLLMPMDDRTVDLMLQFSIKLVRVEPTTRLTEFRTRQTHAAGDGILDYGRERFILDAWTGAESVGFRENFLGEWRLSCSLTGPHPRLEHATDARGDCHRQLQFPADHHPARALRHPPGPKQRADGHGRSRDGARRTTSTGCRAGRLILGCKSRWPRFPASCSSSSDHCSTGCSQPG